MTQLWATFWLYSVWGTLVKWRSCLKSSEHIDLLGGGGVVGEHGQDTGEAGGVRNKYKSNTDRQSLPSLSIYQSTKLPASLPPNIEGRGARNIVYCHTGLTAVVAHIVLTRDYSR